MSSALDMDLEEIAPTFKSLPVDLFTRSHFVALSSTPCWGFDSWEAQPLDEAAAKWAHTVEPCATLEWEDWHEAPSLLNTAVELLQEKGIRPTAIMSDPDFANDLTGHSNFTDMPRLKNDFESIGLNFFCTNWMSYNEGMYVYDDSCARFYKKGRSKHYWCLPPYVVKITRGKNALPTRKGTWFQSPSNAE